MRTEEFKRLLQSHPINANIIEEEQTKARTTKHHEELIKYIDNYH